MSSSTRRRFVGERFHFRIFPFGTPRDSVRLPLRQQKRHWDVIAVCGGVSLFIAGFIVLQLWTMGGGPAGTMSSVTSKAFGLFGILFTSGVGSIFFLITFACLCGWQFAWIGRTRLVHEYRLGPLRFLCEYDLAKIENVWGDTRVVFSYGEGTVVMGDQSVIGRDVSDAVTRLRSALESVEGQAPKVSWEARREPPRRDVPVPAPQAPLTSLSMVALVAANLVPLVCVLFLGWDLGEIMVLFWAESAVIGLYHVLKMAVATGPFVLALGPIFAGHFGAFMAGHFMFIYYLFIRPFGTPGAEPAPLAALAQLFHPLWPCLLAYVVSHGISFRTNFLGRREFAGLTTEQMMTRPYLRIWIMHLTITFGAWLCILLQSPVGMLILLVALKTYADLWSHRRERLRASAQLKPA